MDPVLLDSVLDIAAAVCLLLGAVLSLAAGVGLLRFPDALSRLHAGTKPQILGLGFVVLAIALSARSWAALLLLLPVLLFQLLTAPVSAHMVGRAGYRTGNHDEQLLHVDELAEAVDRASADADADADATDPAVVADVHPETAPPEGSQDPAAR